MDKYRKPAANPKKIVLNILLTGILIAVGIGLILFSVVEVSRYRQVKKVAVTLKATVVQVENTSANDMDYYDVYVVFNYSGEDYRVLYMSSLHEGWRDKVGTEVDITINPSNPTEKLENIPGNIFFSLFFGLPFLFIGILVSGRRSRPTYVETYGINDQTVRKDLRTEFYRKRLWLAFALMPLILISHGLLALGIESLSVLDFLMAFAMCLFAIPSVIYYIKLCKDSQTPFSVNVLSSTADSQTVSICSGNGMLSLTFQHTPGKKDYILIK